MRVLRLCSVFQPPATALWGRGARFDPIGGMQTHTHELSRALDRLGVEQTIVTTRPLTTPREQALGAYGRVVRLGLPIRHFRQLYSWPAARLVPSLAADADLLHVHLGEDLAVVPIASRAARHHGLPLVMTVHTSMRHTLTVTDARSALLKHIGGRIERRGVSAAAAVIVLVPRLANLIQADLNRSGAAVPPIHVIPSGVAPELFDDQNATRADPLAAIPRPRIVFLGRLHAQKQVDTLVAAATKLSGAHVALVGDGPKRPALERLAHALGVAGRVHFLGFVPHENVPAVLRGADVLAMPSRYEELGTALLEAMQAGVPIVATATGGIPHVVQHGHTGLLVPPNDPEALAAALARVLSESDLADGLVGAARNQIARYHWPTLARRVLAVYEETVPTIDSTPRRPVSPTS